MVDCSTGDRIADRSCRSDVAEESTEEFNKSFPLVTIMHRSFPSCHDGSRSLITTIESLVHLDHAAHGGTPDLLSKSKSQVRHEDELRKCQSKPRS